MIPSTDPVVYNTHSLKEKLAIIIMQTIQTLELSQVRAAKILEVTQPRLSNLANGKLERFSLDALFTLVIRLGYDLDTEFKPMNAGTPITITVNKARVIAC